MRRVGEEGEGANLAAGAQSHAQQAWRINAARHFARPQSRESVAHPVRVDAKRHAPARAAAAQPHDEARLALRAAIARGEDAQRPVVAVDPAGSLRLVAEAGRPHQRAVAEDPEVAFGQLREEGLQRHEIQTAAYKIEAMSARRPPIVGRYTGEELALAGRNRGMPLEALRHDVT